MEGYESINLVYWIYINACGQTYSGGTEGVELSNGKETNEGVHDGISWHTL